MEERSDRAGSDSEDVDLPEDEDEATGGGIGVSELTGAATSPNRTTSRTRSEPQVARLALK